MKHPVLWKDCLRFQFRKHPKKKPKRKKNSRKSLLIIISNKHKEVSSNKFIKTFTYYIFFRKKFKMQLLNQLIKMYKPKICKEIVSLLMKFR